ncbi:MAG: hypothetical protein ACI8XG_002264, partial [Congregibacter sp.]
YIELIVFERAYQSICAHLINRYAFRNICLKQNLPRCTH